MLGVLRQTAIYRAGVSGRRPRVPTDATQLEARARKAMPAEAYAYIAGGAGTGATVRANRDGFDRYARGWAELESGVDRRAPLSRYYSAASITSLGEGVRSFRRWGFPQDQAELVAALGETQPVTEALAAAIRGDISPDQAAEKAQSAVEQLQESIR